MTLRSADIVVLVTKGGILPLGNNSEPLKWKLRLLPSHFALLMPLGQQAQKGILVLASDLS